MVILRVRKEVMLLREMGHGYSEGTKRSHVTEGKGVHGYSEGTKRSHVTEGKGGMVILRVRKEVMLLRERGAWL